MLNLDDLRDKLDNMLNKETADSLNEWLNNKRDMDDLIITRIMLSDMLNDLNGLMHGLTEDELDALVDALDEVYVEFKTIVDARNGDQSE
jgi:hypothetical protein